MHFQTVSPWRFSLCWLQAKHESLQATSKQNITVNIVAGLLKPGPLHRVTACLRSNRPVIYIQTANNVGICIDWKESETTLSLPSAGGFWDTVWVLGGRNILSGANAGPLWQERKHTNIWFLLLLMDRCIGKAKPSCVFVNKNVLAASFRQFVGYVPIFCLGEGH